MPSELQQNRYDQLIRRVGGIIGPGSKVSEAISELFPMIDVENVPGELLALMGTRMVLGNTNRGQQAAEHARGQLFNPADSGTIITLTTLSARSDSAQLIQMGIVDTPLVTLNVTRAARDSRWDLTSAVVGQMREDNDAALEPAASFVARIGTAESTIFQDPNGLAVLSPGFGFQVTTTVVNTRITLGFMWRERAAEQSELSF